MSGGFHKRWKKSAIHAAIAVNSAMGVSAASADTPLTAGVVAERMEASDRVPYAAGLVEGIAFARYQLGNQDTDAMACVYDWFFSGQQRTNLIFEAFERFPDYTPGAVVTALVNRACPHE